MSAASFVLLVRPRGDHSPLMRVGFTVTKKIGNAVVRNRLKRRLRAAAAECLSRSGTAGADHILIGRAVGLRQPYAELLRELDTALLKARRRAQAPAASAGGAMPDGARPC